MREKCPIFSFVTDEEDAFFLPQNNSTRNKQKERKEEARFFNLAHFSFFLFFPSLADGSERVCPRLRRRARWAQRPPRVPKRRADETQASAALPPLMHRPRRRRPRRHRQVGETFSPPWPPLSARRPHPPRAALREKRQRNRRRSLRSRHFGTEGERISFEVLIHRAGQSKEREKCERR